MWWLKIRRDVSTAEDAPEESEVTAHTGLPTPVPGEVTP